MSATPVAHVKGVVQQRHLASLQGHPVIKLTTKGKRLKQQGREARHGNGARSQDATQTARRSQRRKVEKVAEELQVLKQCQVLEK